LSLQCIDIVITFIYNKNMTTIQVRSPLKNKKAVQKILEELGLDMSTAINLYLVQIIKHGGIPFPILTENGMTPEAEEAILKETEEIIKNGETYPNIKAAHKAILGE